MHRHQRHHTGAFDMPYRTNRSNTVTVFGFKTFDADTREMQLVNCKATPEAIASFRLAELVAGTGEEVPLQALDAQGCYRRVATGWAALD